MVNLITAEKMACSLAGTTMKDHVGRPSFRVKNKIFMTLWPIEKRAVIKLSLVDQSVFCDYDRTVFYPVKGAWGKQGWTTVELKKVRKSMFSDALTQAWRSVAPK